MLKVVEASDSLGFVIIDKLKEEKKNRDVYKTCRVNN